MRIDAHQHVWSLARGDYGWLTPQLEPIYRDFGPDDLAPLLAAAGVNGTVLVQAAATSAETDFMLSVADGADFIEGVVGWIDFEDPRSMDTLRRFTRHPKFRGVRPLIQDIPDVDWMLRPDLDWAFRAIIDLDITFDVLGHPKHLANALTLLKRYPEMRAVVDHCMKPDIAAGQFDDWAAGIARIAEETQAFCKLSGLVTEAGAGWTADRLRPYVAHVLTIFGPHRVMWGSDWPVLNLAGDYARWNETAAALVGESLVDQVEIDAVFGDTAVRFYRLG
jgi:L-fuconolactonase